MIREVRSRGSHLISANPALLGHALGVPPLPAFLPSSFVLGGICDDSFVQTANPVTVISSPCLTTGQLLTMPFNG